MISTYAFEASHGRKPRGQGGWMFCLRSRWDKQGYLEHVFYFEGYYSEAKRAAVAYFAPRFGSAELVVCP